MRLLNKIRNLRNAEKNILADKKAIPLTVDLIIKQIAIKISDLEINEKEFLEWQRNYFPEGESMFNTSMHKKMLELFVSFKLLDIKNDDIYLDAAGGQYSYASRVNCKKKIIQDIRLSDKLKSFHGTEVTYLDSSCDSIPLPDEGVNKISCHHSIEHFQKNADSDFMIELQRLLAPGGKCVILPIFISDKPLLITVSASFDCWNETGEWLVDTTATLPGGKGSGHFSRVYNPTTLKNRLLDKLNPAEFSYRIVSIKMNRKEIPDATLFMNAGQAIINHHYKALVIERQFNIP